MRTNTSRGGLTPFSSLYSFCIVVHRLDVMYNETERQVVLSNKVTTAIVPSSGYFVVCLLGFGPRAVAVNLPPLPVELNLLPVAQQFCTARSDEPRIIRGQATSNTFFTSDHDVLYYTPRSQDTAIKYAYTMHNYFLGYPLLFVCRAQTTEQQRRRWLGHPFRAHETTVSTRRSERLRVQGITHRAHTTHKK